MTLGNPMQATTSVTADRSAGVQRLVPSTAVGNRAAGGSEQASGFMQPIVPDWATTVSSTLYSQGNRFAVLAVDDDGGNFVAAGPTRNLSSSTNVVRPNVYVNVPHLLQLTRRRWHLCRRCRGYNRRSSTSVNSSSHNNNKTLNSSARCSAGERQLGFCRARCRCCPEARH